MYEARVGSDENDRRVPLGRQVPRGGRVDRRALCFPVPVTVPVPDPVSVPFLEYSTSHPEREACGTRRT
ncbi:hypothetical protein [Natronosalvus rutilus]|uniref:Uncharacterized protein n=1 Tax=Natronosalvus rutilus TaxID=2953753 RepID=A0A9E7NCM6_9EURY|nr:hypothetical protein [Natronosalvus rutilus]UTF55036.1 hypothetical protein NGM29_07230 [Natronosalvus rutilus]